jgi:CheY-like chemotaxis protein
MKIHETHTGIFLRTLADFINRDPASVAGWSCLLFPGLLSHSADALQRMDAQLHELDGALVAGANQDVLIFYRALGGAGHSRLAQLAHEALGMAEPPAGRCFDLTLEWKAAVEAIDQQISQLDASGPHQRKQISPEEIDGIAHMAVVLQSSKFTRQYRTPMTVMLVEDDPVTRQLASKLLSQDHVLVTAASAYEAVVNYLLYAPEIVFLDINLPDESGFIVLDQLTACDPDAYIVMFSGNDGIDNIIDARTRGAQGFVTKPFQRDRLKHYLAERRQLVEQTRSTS